MDIKLISKFLIFFGVALILIGLNVDTSVSTGFGRVHNIGLVSQQQNFLIIGGLAFIAGIILFATHQPDNTNSEELEDTVESEKKYQETIDRRVEKADKFFRSIFDSIFGFLDRWISAQRDNVLGRIAVYLYTAPYAFPFGWPLFIIIGLYSARPAPAQKVITHLLYFHTALDIFVVVICLTGGNLNKLTGWVFPVGCSALAIINYSIICYLKRQEASKLVSPVN